MGYFAELDWDTREDEQAEMESDPHYINWLNQYNKSFTQEVELWYNILIDNETGVH